MTSSINSKVAFHQADCNELFGRDRLNLGNEQHRANCTEYLRVAICDRSPQRLDYSFRAFSGRLTSSKLKSLSLPLPTQVRFVTDKAARSGVPIDLHITGTLASPSSPARLTSSSTVDGAHLICLYDRYIVLEFQAFTSPSDVAPGGVLGSELFESHVPPTRH